VRVCQLFPQIQSTSTSASGSRLVPLVLGKFPIKHKPTQFHLVRITKGLFRCFCSLAYESGFTCTRESPWGPMVGSNWYRDMAHGYAGKIMHMHVPTVAGQLRFGCRWFKSHQLLALLSALHSGNSVGYLASFYFGHAIPQDSKPSCLGEQFP
jgi:hypothetical protein